MLALQRDCVIVQVVHALHFMIGGGEREIKYDLWDMVEPMARNELGCPTFRG